ATGTLLAADALGQGPHRVDVAVVDRAGNAAAPVAHTFTVDPVPPTAAVDAPPDGAYLGTAQPLVRVTYGDSDPRGVDPTTARVEIDGLDRTAEFTVSADHAEATLATPLAEG